MGNWHRVWISWSRLGLIFSDVQPSSEYFAIPTDLRFAPLRRQINAVTILRSENEFKGFIPTSWKSEINYLAKNPENLKKLEKNISDFNFLQETLNVYKTVISCAPGYQVCE